MFLRHPLRQVAIFSLLASLVPHSAAAQDTPPTFEETPPSEAGGVPQFRMSYPVRDAASGQTFTEQRPGPPADVPTAVSDSDIAAGLAMPDPGPPPSPTPSGSVSDGAAEAAFETVGSSDASTEELPPDENFRTGRGPLRYTVYVQQGYNSNVNGRKNNPVQSAFTSLGAGVDYEFGTSRLELVVGFDAGVTYYYNNKGLQNNGLFPNGALTLGADYEVSDRLRLFLDSSTSLLAQPNFAIVGTPTNYQGDYVVSYTTLGVEYQWLPKFGTITTYTPGIWYYYEPIGDNFSRFDQTVGQQFVFMWKPVTQLVAEYRFNTRNYWYVDDYNSLGNYALLGFNHRLNPRSELVFRGGAEQRVNQVPVTGGTYNYIGPFAELGLNYALREETTTLGLRSRYGTTASGVGGYNQGQQFLAGLDLQHAFGRRLVGRAWLNYQNNFYNQPDNFAPDFYTNVFNTGLSASFAINRIWSVNAGYSFTGLLSTDDLQQNSYNQNIIFVGTALDF